MTVMINEKYRLKMIGNLRGFFPGRYPNNTIEQKLFVKHFINKLAKAVFGNHESLDKDQFIIRVMEIANSDFYNEFINSEYSYIGISAIVNSFVYLYLMVELNGDVIDPWHVGEINTEIQRSLPPLNTITADEVINLVKTRSACL